MIIICPVCEKKFEINQNLIPEKGRLLQCGSCNKTWFYKKKDIIESNLFETKIVEENNEKNLKEEIKKEKEKTTHKKITSDIIDNQEIVIKENNNETVKQPKKNKNNISFFKSLLVIIISFIALIILIDTFKDLISIFVPNIEYILQNLYETLYDVFLFFNDLF